MTRILSNHLFLVILMCVGVIAAGIVLYAQYPSIIHATPMNYGQNNSGGVFAGYNSWSSSDSPKENDYLRQSLELLPITTNFLPGTQVGPTLFSNTQYVDINADGLIDQLSYGETLSWNYPSTKFEGSYYSVFLNKGNLTFDLAYKCVYTKTTASGNWKWFGNCAQ